jgi:hypothetical protein
LLVLSVDNVYDESLQEVFSLIFTIKDKDKKELLKLQTIFEEVVQSGLQELILWVLVNSVLPVSLVLLQLLSA